jgi:membrane-bound lytic murein transglycosylase D
VASIPVDKRVWWRYHRVQGEESLASIARTYHTTPRAIAEANDINEGLNHELDRAAVPPDTRLIIPIATNKNQEPDTSTYARATTHYKVRKGDTVESVAENFGVSAKMVRGWNHIKGDSLAGKKMLYLHLPVTRTAGERQSASAPSTKPKHRAGSGVTTASASVAPRPGDAPHTSVTHAAVTRHTVRQGETLYSIANSYKTTVSALKKDNRDIATLRPGMILIVHDGH